MLNWNPIRPHSRGEHLRELAFAWGLTSAMAYALIVYVGTHDLDYYLLRAAIRVDDILHFAQTNAVTTEALRRHSQNSWTLIAGLELTILISMFAAMMVVLVFLRISPNAWHRVIMGNRCSGFLAFFALPLSYLCTRSWRAGPDLAFSPYADTAVESQLARLFWLLLAADVICFAVLSLVARVRPLSTWTSSVLLVLHCVFWLTVTAMSSPLSLVSGVASLSIVAFPFSGAVWLRYFKMTEESAAATAGTRRVGKWKVAITVAFCLMLLAIWYPGRAYSLAHPRSIGSVSIEMSRGPCFGSCPIYSLTLHGDGLVEYRGIRFVGIKEAQTARINVEELMLVLRDLERMHFFTVEDRAFQWAYDSPSVTISVSVDGRQKRVTADGVCFAGLNGGPKTSILRIADEIDEIVGSKQWVQCNGFCRN